MQKIKKYFTELYAYDEFPKDWDFVQTYFLVFFCGCVIGWVYEELFYYYIESKLLNSGFFYGPYLPVYGFGGLLILICTRPLRKNPLNVIVCSMLVTGILEYITGYVMYAIWKARWWDYRGLFLNIDGFVCLRSVLTFAVAGVALVYAIEPMIRKFCITQPKTKRNLSILFFTIFAIDVILTMCIREHVPMI